MFPYAPPDVDAWMRFLKDALVAAPPPAFAVEPRREPSRPAAPVD